MKYLYADAGGRPGIDCGGFCHFCFYKNVDYNRIKTLKLGCVHCPPHQIGCEKCKSLINRVNNNFKPLKEVYRTIEKQLFIQELYGGSRNLKLVVNAGADIFNYPQLFKLVSVLKETGLPLHLGYTSGKAIKTEGFGWELISRGLDELSFSVLSTDPEVRRMGMGDKNPQEAVKTLKIFCENIDVHASSVVIPGVNDYQEIVQTCCDLEEWGVKTFVLRRFANYKRNGLILNNDQPIIDGVTPHTYTEFQNLVRKISHEFSFKILAFPFYDADKDFPFALLKSKNHKFLGDITSIKKPATIVTGKLAYKFLNKFFKLIDGSSQVNVVAVEKEISDLITPEDLENVDLSHVKSNVVIPRGALVHNVQAQKILSKDGESRNIKRGPYSLTHPYYEGLDFNEDQVIEYELKSFNHLISVVNDFKD